MLVIEELVKDETITATCDHCGDKLTITYVEDGILSIASCKRCEEKLQHEAYERGWNNALNEPILGKHY